MNLTAEIESKYILLYEKKFWYFNIDILKQISIKKYAQHDKLKMTCKTKNMLTLAVTTGHWLANTLELVFFAFVRSTTRLKRFWRFPFSPAPPLGSLQRLFTSFICLILFLFVDNKICRLLICIVSIVFLISGGGP